MSTDDAIRQAWQRGASGTAPPDLAALRDRAERFHRKIRRRTRLEYAACLLVLMGFSAYALVLPSPAQRLGSALILGGALIVAWGIHSRTTSTAAPEKADVRPLLLHQRDQLERQRRAAASVPVWYLAPLAPGIAVFMLAPALDGSGGMSDLSWQSWLSIACTATVFAGAWWFNHCAARRLAREIDGLNRLLQER